MNISHRNIDSINVFRDSLLGLKSFLFIKVKIFDVSLNVFRDSFLKNSIYKLRFPFYIKYSAKIPENTATKWQSVDRNAWASKYFDVFAQRFLFKTSKIFDITSPNFPFLRQTSTFLTSIFDSLNVFRLTSRPKL